MIDVSDLIGTHDVLLMTIDTLRYDVVARRDPIGTDAQPGGRPAGRGVGGAPFAGQLHLRRPSRVLRRVPAHAGRARQAPASLRRPLPGQRDDHRADLRPRCSRHRFGAGGRGYHTICIGGVGFFNKLGPLGSVLPGLFAESHWGPELGVTDPRSTENQVALAVERLGAMPTDRRAFLFLNVSAVHQPNRFYLEGAVEDSIASHAAALEYVDRCLPPLFDALRRRGPSLVIACSDHGTAYGEGGYHGHRLAHPVVWTVPYAEFLLSETGP